MASRQVPKHIDKKARSFEYLMAFALPFFLLRAIFPVGAMFISMGIAIIYIKGTAGKPDGFLQQEAYRKGLPVRGFIPKALKRLYR